MTSIERVIHDTRQLCESMVNPYQDHQPLTEQLEQFILSRQPSGRGTLSLLISPEDPQAWNALNGDGRVSHALYYAVREAVENALKADNGHAINVIVRCVITDQEYCIEVKDDGPGFDVNNALSDRRQHRGLALMKARVKRIGADLDIRSELGEGTSVMISGTIEKLNGDNRNH